MIAWSELGPVDGELVAALARRQSEWPPVKGGQPNRVRLPAEAVALIDAVLTMFAGDVTYSEQTACLSRLVPGQTYEYHRDPQPPNWITRVHVPLTTNPGCWFMWQPDDGVKVHFEVGNAYSFNTLIPHNFGNDGEAERVHLLFDVLRR